MHWTRASTDQCCVMVTKQKHLPSWIIWLGHLPDWCKITDCVPVCDPHLLLFKVTENYTNLLPVWCLSNEHGDIKQNEWETKTTSRKHVHCHSQSHGVRILFDQFEVFRYPMFRRKLHRVVTLPEAFLFMWFKILRCNRHFTHNFTRLLHFRCTHGAAQVEWKDS